jgi:hypothetical protein
MGLAEARTFMATREENSGRGGSGRRRIIRRESVDDASFLQIIGSHLHLDAVPRENTNTIHTHPTREMAEEFMILGLITDDTNSEHGVWKCFFHDADEFYNILL